MQWQLILAIQIRELHLEPKVARLAQRLSEGELQQTAGEVITQILEVWADRVHASTEVEVVWKVEGGVGKLGRHIELQPCRNPLRLEVVLTQPRDVELLTVARVQRIDLLIVRALLLVGCIWRRHGRQLWRRRHLHGRRAVWYEWKS